MSPRLGGANGGGTLYAAPSKSAYVSEAPSRWFALTGQEGDVDEPDDDAGLPGLSEGMREPSCSDTML